MTGKDIFKALGELDSRIVLSAAPEEDVSSKTSHSATFSIFGAIAAAIVILILAVPMLLDMLPSDELVVDNYNEVIDKCDLAVFGTYKGKTEKLTYSEYTFEVTEVLKGETEEKEITVRSEKKSIFSEDEMEKYAQSVNASFEEGQEYFLTLQGSVDEVINFISEQIVAVNDSASSSADFSEFLEENGITIEMTREELESFLRYIFAKTDNETDSGLQLAFSGYDYVITGYVGNEKHIEIPREYNGYPIQVIDERVFKNSNIESVVFNGYIVINESAFYNCDSLKSVTFKDGGNIGENSFSQCDSLENLVIEGKGSRIGDSAFYGCRALRSAMLGCVRTIEDSAFQKCRSLETVVLSEYLMDFCGSALDGCTSLNCTVYENVKYIGSPDNPYMVAVSYADEKMTSFTVLEDTKFILNDAFHSLRYLEEVSFERSTIRRVGEDAFFGCAALKRVDISDINQWCSITFESAEANPLYYAGNLYLNGELVTELNLNMFSVGSFVFAGATCLKTADFSNVQYIRDNAFIGCKYLTKIKFSSYIKGMSLYAFGSWNSIQAYFDGTIEQCKQEKIEASLSIIICTDGILYR